MAPNFERDAFIAPKLEGETEEAALAVALCSRREMLAVFDRLLQIICPRYFTFSTKGIGTRFTVMTVSCWIGSFVWLPSWEFVIRYCGTGGFIQPFVLTVRSCLL